MTDFRDFDGAPEAYAKLAGNLIESKVGKGLSQTQLAMRAWRDANGNVEARHTRALFVKDARREGDPPILYVYLDSNIMVQEFTTKKPIYLARLAAVGYQVSGLEFRLSKKPRETGKTHRFEKQKKPVVLLPELSADEVAQIDAQTASLEEPLRSSVRKAMISSMRKQKAK